MPAKKSAPAKKPSRLKALAEKPVSPLASIVSFGSVLGLVGAIYLIEDRYVHAADFATFRAEIKSDRQIESLKTEIGQYEIRLQLARDSLAQLSFAPGPRTQLIARELERRGELVRDIGLELAAKKTLLDKLRSR